jgi:hypothetical protein
VRSIATLVIEVAVARGTHRNRFRPVSPACPPADRSARPRFITVTNEQKCCPKSVF